jgi:hypothetical protein
LTVQLDEVLAMGSIRAKFEALTVLEIGAETISKLLLLV